MPERISLLARQLNHTVCVDAVVVEADCGGQKQHIIRHGPWLLHCSGDGLVLSSAENGSCNIVESRHKAIVIGKTPSTIATAVTKMRWPLAISIIDYTRG